MKPKYKDIWLPPKVKHVTCSQRAIGTCFAQLARVEEQQTTLLLLWYRDIFKHTKASCCLFDPLKTLCRGCKYSSSPFFCLRLHARKVIWWKQKMEKPIWRLEIQKISLMAIHIGWIRQKKLTHQTSNLNTIQGNCSQWKMIACWMGGYNVIYHKDLAYLIPGLRILNPENFAYHWFFRIWGSLVLISRILNPQDQDPGSLGFYDIRVLKILEIFQHLEIFRIQVSQILRNCLLLIF